MASIRWFGNPERTAAINAVLPEKPITDDLVPLLLKLCKKPLLAALKQEIEIYKAFPKQGRMDKLTFDTTNHKTCFMGQGFNVKSGEIFDDADLRDYRKAVGTYKHGTWGNATLLEIWGADHFKKYKPMVKGVFSYCKGERATLPALTFYVFPLFSHKESGGWTLDEDDKDVFRYTYLTELNGHIAMNTYNKKIKPLTFEDLEKDKSLKEDFGKAWERKKNHATPLEL
jgi:hypothetical protein